MSKADSGAKTDWQRMVADYAIASAEYAAAYRAFEQLIADRISYDCVTSPEILAEHRARENLLALRRRMNSLDPERAQAVTLEFGSQ